MFNLGTMYNNRGTASAPVYYNPREVKVQALSQLVGNTLSKSILETVLESNDGDFEKSLEAVLSLNTMNSTPNQTPQLQLQREQEEEEMLKKIQEISWEEEQQRRRKQQENMMDLKLSYHHDHNNNNPHHNQGNAANGNRLLFQSTIELSEQERQARNEERAKKQLEERKFREEMVKNERARKQAVLNQSAINLDQHNHGNQHKFAKTLDLSMHIKDDFARISPPPVPSSAGEELSQRLQQENSRESLENILEKKSNNDEAAKATQQLNFSEKTSALPDEVDADVEKIDHTKTDSPAEITLSKDQYERGETIEVSWNIPPHLVSPYDWIGIYCVSEYSNTVDYVSYFKTKGKPSSSDNFRLPSTEAIYQFCYMSGGALKTLLGKSKRFTVGPIMALKVENSGEFIRVTMEGKTSPSDFLGIFYASETNQRNYLRSKYVTSNPLLFPSPRSPGDYQFRYFSYYSSYNALAVSSVIHIEDKDVIEICSENGCDAVVVGSEILVKYLIYSISPSNSNWIALFSISQKNNSKYLSFKYLANTTEGSVSFTAPSQPGQYEFRLFSANSSATEVKRSKPFIVLQ